jgi:hypothetical protein
MSRAFGVWTLEYCEQRTLISQVAPPEPQTSAHFTWDIMATYILDLRNATNVIVVVMGYQNLADGATL